MHSLDRWQNVFLKVHHVNSLCKILPRLTSSLKIKTNSTTPHRELVMSRPLDPAASALTSAPQGTRSCFMAHSHLPWGQRLPPRAACPARDAPGPTQCSRANVSLPGLSPSSPEARSPPPSSLHRGSGTPTSRALSHHNLIPCLSGPTFSLDYKLSEAKHKFHPPVPEEE